MFSKWVTIIISPLGTSLLLGLVALTFGLIARWKLSLRIGVLAWAWLWVWSMPLTSDVLMGWIEEQAGPRQIAELPQTKVMVVLGGGISGPRLPRRPNPDLNSSADRLWQAARLYRAGKASQMILTGGVVRTGDGSEAQSMRSFLLDLGVPLTVMTLEEVSENTAGNARFTAEMLAKQGVSEILLVTSALHMQRAKRLFEKVGLKVIPAPTDFEVIDTPFDFLRIMPDANALNGSARAIKELLGYWVS